MEHSQLVSYVRAIAAYGKEIEALRETMNELMATELAKSSLKCRVAGPIREADRQDDSGWVFTDCGCALPLAGRRAGNGKREMYLGYQISLLGDGIAIPGNDDALLHMCFWDCEFDFEEPGEHVHFPWPADNQPSVEDGRLLVWRGTGDDWKSRQWIFTVKLLTLDSSQALLDRLIRPAIALIGGAAANVALREDMRGLVTFSVAEEESK